MPTAVRITATGQRTAMIEPDDFRPDTTFRFADDIGVAPNGDLVVTKATAAFRFSTTDRI